MRIFKKALVFTMMFCVIGTTYVLAAEDSKNNNIIIDGNFDDWEGKPSYVDNQGDTPNTGEDLKELRYFSDEDYLYIYVERYSAANGFDIRIPVLNGIGYEQPNFFPWDNKGKPAYEWTSTNVTSFNIRGDYSQDRTYRISVRLGWEDIGEDRVFTNSDGTKFEVRLPLDKIGLSGPNKTIKFAVSSNVHQENSKIDWIPEDGPIIVTTGPVFGVLTPILAFSGFVGVGLLATKRKKNIL